MNRPRFKSGCLTHSFCGTSCWRCQKNVHAFHLKISDDRIDRSCLTCTRTTCDDQKTVSYRLFYRLHLMFIQLHSCLFLNVMDPLLYLCICHIIGNIQFPEHCCRICFHIIKRSWINLRLLSRLLHNDFPFNWQIHIIFFDDIFVDSQQFTCFCCQFLLWQKGMPLTGRLKQCIQYTASHTEIRIRPYSCLCCNIVRCPETNSLDIICQPVRILF